MNFEDISKKLKQFSKDTVTEVQKLNEVRQLNSRISDEKKQLNQVYMEMGKKLYQMYKEAPLDGFEEEMRTIEEKYSMIDLLQDQIRQVKGVVLCPCCNTEVAATERFCSNCGNKMPEVITAQEEAEVLEGEVVAEEAVEEESEAADETVEETVETVENEAAEETVETVEEAAEAAEDEAAEENAETAEDEAVEETAEPEEKESTDSVSE